MDLLEMLKSHHLRRGAWLNIKWHPEEKLCIRCNNPISEFGRTKTYCEYHWLKRKYAKIKENCVDGGEYKRNRREYLTDIYCKITWREFIYWAIDHPEYKDMKDPALTRINMGKDFTVDNLKWVEFDEISKFKKSQDK